MYLSAFFVQVCYAPHIISTSNIYFGLLLLIPIILSYMAAGYNHFIEIWKLWFLAQKSMLFSAKIKKNVKIIGFNLIKILQKHSKISEIIHQKVFLGKFLFLDSSIIFICQSKHQKIRFLRGKHRFWAKNDHFSNFDKMGVNGRIRLLYSSKW